MPFFDCVAAPCQQSCPVQQDVPGYARLIAAGRPEQALRLILEKFKWYLVSPRSALWTFAPVFYLAAVGLVMRAVGRRRDAILLIGGPLLLMVYILTVETYGGAAFGPRYLLPALPLLAVGLIPLLKWIESPEESGAYRLRPAVKILLGLAFAAGITICFTGALRGTMYGMEPHPFLQRLKVGLGLRGIRETPGAFPLIYPIITLLSLVFYFLPSRTLRPIEAPPDEG